MVENSHGMRDSPTGVKVHDAENSFKASFPASPANRCNAVLFADMVLLRRQKIDVGMRDSSDSNISTHVSAYSEDF